MNGVESMESGMGRGECSAVRYCEKRAVRIYTSLQCTALYLLKEVRTIQNIIVEVTTK